MRIAHLSAPRSALLLATFLFFGLIPPSHGKACGNLGQPACHECVEKVTVYFPFNFCCIPESSECLKAKYSCHSGYEIDQSGNCTRPRLSTTQAVSAGCRSEKSAEQILAGALKASNLGSSTRSQIEKFSSSADWMTTLLVTDPSTWGYRATDFPAEIKSLEAGKMLSKAQRRVKKSNNPSGFWSVNGPQLTASTPVDLRLAFQMIATSDSGKPMSQYVSVALDYKVASAFGNTVYKFQMAPNSAVLGLRNCSLSGGGETQIQVPGGTPITNLHRFEKSKGYWEVYKNGSWRRAN